MIKARFPLVVALTLMVEACAQPPLRNSPTLAAESARYGVSQELLLRAGRAGYSPEIRHGKTVFCTEQAQTFSYIPRAECFDKTQMTTRLQQSAAALGALQRRVSTMPAAPGPASGR
jgi:hypothetical protein